MSRLFAVVTALSIAACQSTSPPPDAAVDGPTGEAILIVMPGGIDFGDVGAGPTGSPFTTITVVNKGQLTSGPVESQLQFTDASLFRIITDGCRFAMIPPLGECSLQVQFRPDTPTGAKQARLVIYASPGGENIIPLMGNAVVDTSPKLVTNTNSALFGSQAVGTTSANFPFTITNTGAMPSGAITATLMGTNPNQFGVNSACSAPLAGSASCTVNVTFAPTTVGSFEALLVVNASPGGSVMMILEGNGANIALSAAPLIKDYGAVGVGLNSPTTTFNITNTGTSAAGPLTSMFTGANAADFNIVTDNCTNNNIGGGATCSIGVRFHPQTTGPKSSDLLVRANGATATVALAGLAVTDPGVFIIANPMLLDFGDQAVASTSSPLAFTVTNQGATTSGTITVATSGGAASSFDASSGCTTLAPAASCTVNVTFTPAVAGSLQASVAVTVMGGNSPAIVVKGNGI